MKQKLKQSDITAQINALAEQIFLRMCTTAHRGFDATHYVRRSYELAKVFYQNIDSVNASPETDEVSTNNR